MSSLFKFRKYKKEEGNKHNRSKHPKLIVEEDEKFFGFMGLTESRKSGHRANIPLIKNPKKNDKRPAYIRKELRRDVKENFEEILNDYNLSNKDLNNILDFLEKYKKKK